MDALNAVKRARDILRDERPRRLPDPIRLHDAPEQDMAERRADRVERLRSSSAQRAWDDFDH